MWEGLSTIPDCAPKARLRASSTRYGAPFRAKSRVPACAGTTAESHSFSIFGITSLAINVSERSACSSVSVPKNR